MSASSQGCRVDLINICQGLDELLDTLNVFDKCDHSCCSCWLSRAQGSLLNELINDVRPAFQEQSNRTYTRKRRQGSLPRPLGSREEQHGPPVPCRVSDVWAVT